MKKVYAAILILILIAGLLTGCGQKASGANTTAQPAASATEGGASASVPEDHGKLKVSFPAGSVRVSINILAQELGYFQEEGVTVEPVNLGGVDALTAINGSGDQLDILNTGFVNDIQSIGGGYDLTFIAGTAVEGGAVIAKKGQAERFKSADTIIDIEAVTEAKLGFVRNEAAWVITRQYLLNNGVPAETIAAQLLALRAAVRDCGCPLPEPFLQMAFLPLPVIPHLKLTDLGLVDVDRFELL